MADIGTSYTITANGTYTVKSVMKNPSYQLTGATWGSGTVQVTVNGHNVAGASYTAAMTQPIQIQAERPVELAFVMSGSTSPSVSVAVW